jgi:hypothetical protein
MSIASSAAATYVGNNLKDQLDHTPFKHEPLELHSKSIRLFRLLSTSKATIYIEGEIQHFNLRNVPPFKTLSYTWGTSAQTFKILIDSRQFLMSENLYNFFQTARSDLQSSNENWLWVDQICIDQSNILERNHQVSQMAEIYRAASQVIIWLGLETDTVRRL